MTKIEEIMTKDVLVVYPDTPVSMAVKLLAIKKVTGLPVVDENKSLLGIITEKDLMRLLIDQESVEEKTVADFMTKDVKCFSPENSAIEVCAFLLENLFRRVPIVKDNKLVGVVSRADIISLLWKERFEKNK